MSTINNEDDQYFLWLSDIHFDPHYSTSDAFIPSSYADANCKSSDQIPSIGKHACDTPRSLVSAMLEHALNITSARTPSSPAFIVVSGDSIRHGVDQLFKKGEFLEGGEARSDNSHGANSAVEQAANAPYHLQAMQAAGEILHELVSMLEQAFPETEIIVSIGNNDVVPDYYLRLQDESAPLGNSNLTPELAGMVGVIFNALSAKSAGGQSNAVPKKGILTQNDEWTFLRGGYYSRTLHNDTLTILSLNTVLYSGYFSPTPMNDDDPGLQFSWMRKILSYCQETGTQAIIVGHIPPAVGSYHRHTQLWKESYIDTYYEIVKEFDGVVIGQLFGHLHSDEFRVGLAEESDSKAMSMIPSMNTPLLLAPSITPLHGNDPSFRLVKYGRRGGVDGKPQNGNYRLLDYDTHRFSIGTGNDWSTLYTFSEAYSVASDIIKDEGLSSQAFQTIVESMEDNYWGGESPLLETYRSFMLSGADGDGSSSSKGANVGCDPTCRDEALCTFQSATRLGYDNCLLERQQVWIRNGRSIFGLVGVALFATALLFFVVVRCRKGKRDNYESTPSVTDNRNLEIDETDEEMI
ncbi:hypothetical protein ACHAXR_003328 [Thalassiosira sp. AJA248-18]